MTDWWSTAPAGQDDEAGRQEWQAQAGRDMERIARSGEDLSGEPDDWGHGSNGEIADLRQSHQEPGPEPQQKPDRRKTLILGAAGAAIVGALVFTMMPDGSAKAPGGSVAPSSATEEGFLPAAGSGPSEAVQGDIGTPTSRAPGVVTMTAVPDGTGSAGAIVKLTIRNGTDETVVVMSSMVKGDSRPAVIGEGTLAPGSRRIEPGETATGTVEFAAKKAPSQVILTDLGGNVVAASE